MEGEVEGYEKLVLFKGTFRLPVMGGARAMDVIVIGDWAVLTQIGLDKGYVNVLPCLMQQVSENQDIRMVVFTGDMAYDLQGKFYRPMLEMISELSSKMAFMVTPGNHDTLYHADTFELFTESFYTPRWKDYYNYFFTLQLGRVVFISYNPEIQVNIS